LAVASAGTWALLLMLATAAVLLRSEAADRNSENARFAAVALNRELMWLAYRVEERAANQHLIDLLTSDPPEPRRQELLEAHLRDITTTGMPAFINWALMTREGDLLVRWPKRKPVFKERGRRDYFVGPTTKPDTPYISRVYLSKEDGKTKFGVCRAILSPDRQILGVLAAMVTTSSTEGPFGFSPFRKVIIVGEADRVAPTDALADRTQLPPYVIVGHPSFRIGEAAVGIDHPHIRKLLESETPNPDVLYGSGFRDPVSRTPSILPRRWLAGFARVHDTYFVVIYQSSDRVFDAIGTTALLAAAAALIAGSAGLLAQVRNRLRH
jgi:hypothetical protein